MNLMIVLIAVVCLAYANGANDNFKGDGSSTSKSITSALAAR
jgi:hypothetical protein